MQQPESQSLVREQRAVQLVAQVTSARDPLASTRPTRSTTERAAARPAQDRRSAARSGRGRTIAAVRPSAFGSAQPLQSAVGKPPKCEICVGNWNTSLKGGVYGEGSLTKRRAGKPRRQTQNRF